jgi:hypothetical protein
MAIVVHPDAERGSPADTVAQVNAMLDAATDWVQGFDSDGSPEMSCPIRFRAADIRRLDPAPSRARRARRSRRCCCRRDPWADSTAARRTTALRSACWLAS